MEHLRNYKLVSKTGLLKPSISIVVSAVVPRREYYDAVPGAPKCLIMLTKEFILCLVMVSPLTHSNNNFFTQNVIYKLKIDTIYMYDIPFDRSFLHLSNGIRHIMPSTDRKLELTAKASMAQPVSQPALCCNGLSMSDKIIMVNSSSLCRKFSFPKLLSRF